MNAIMNHMKMLRIIKVAEGIVAEKNSFPVIKIFLKIYW